MKSLRLNLFCVTFILSLTFPVTGAVTSLSYKTVGYVDMITAIALAVMAIFIYVHRSHDKTKGARRLTIDIYKLIFSVPLILLGMFLAGLHIKWDILLIGFAWRFWLLSFILEDLVQYFRKSGSRRWNREHQ